MSLVALVCPQCGGDLDVPANVQIFRCTYCDSKVRLVESANVRGLELLEAGVRRILEHSQVAAAGVSELLEARAVDERRRAAEREEWESGRASLEATRQLFRRRARICAVLVLLSVFLLGPGLTYALATMFAAELGAHLIWPLLAGIAVALTLSKVQNGYQVRAEVITERLDRWLDRRPLS